MRRAKKRRDWNLSPEDLPPEAALRRADYLVGLENNAVFRLLTFRETPFWRRVDFVIWLVIGLFSGGLAALGLWLFALAFVCASAVVFYLVHVFWPDEALLESLTAEDLGQLLPTRVGAREITQAIWGIRTSRCWLVSRLRAARIMFYAGWAMVLAPLLFDQVLGLAFGRIPADTSLVGALLIAAGASLPRRLRASPAHALPACLRIVNAQAKRLEARDQPLEYHLAELGKLAWSAFGKFAVIFLAAFMLVFSGALIGNLVWLASRFNLTLQISPDIEGLVTGSFAWIVGLAEGEGWRRFVEPDMRRNYMELSGRVAFILGRETRHLRHATLAQMLPQPDGRH